MLRSPSVYRKVLLAVLFLALVYGLMAIALRTIGLENAHHFIQRAGALAPVLFVLICSVSLIFAPISGSSVIVMGGVLFGHNVAFVLSLLGSILGCSANFWISRKLGRKVVTRLIGHNELAALDRFSYRLKSHQGIVYMILLMPIAQDIVSYAVGLTKISYWHFLIALTISGVAIVAVYTYLGSSLLEAML
ncbi:MAG TPA: TVP38/TMEM64 family protein [Synechococcales cyanobacterium M55_K2018_004]|nr:TVP38/TMEM64 family protein [Synechococcales cyanobacterium M55_K2018_004]